MAIALATTVALLSPSFLHHAVAAPMVDDLPTLNITTINADGTENPGAMAAVNADPDHDTTAIARMTFEGVGATTILNPVGEIKGRGNYTWTLDKRPYQIKFPDSISVLGMASAKTWVLLANAADASLMRNKAAFEFANAIGMPFSPESRWVDVRINGKYMGNYLICEKTEVKKNRVVLTDPTGVLVELDNRYGDSEPYRFRTNTSKTLFTLKDAKSDIPDLPTPLPAETESGWNDVKATLNRLDALLAVSPVNWAEVEKIIDVDSFVKYYWVYELTANSEITGSSVYFYKDGPTSKLFAGPVWDFDSALGAFDRAPWYGSEAGSDYAKSVKSLKDANNPVTAPDHNGWFETLFRQQPFVERSNALWADGIGKAVAETAGKTVGWEASLTKSAAENFKRWPILGKPSLLVAGIGKNYASTYAGEVSYLRNWLTTRSTMLLKEQAPTPLLSYEGHVQDIGWQGRYNFGQVAGTMGLSKRVEAVRVWTPGTNAIQNIEGNAHVQNIGWMGYKNAAEIGTTGRSLRVEAVQYRLTGDLATKYDISYRAHVQDIGWQGWVTNGAVAGTTGQSKRIEAIQIRLLAKSAPTPNLPTVVTAKPVTFNDVCNTENDTYTIPATTGVDYLVGTTVTAAGTYPATGTVTVTAQAKANYVLTGTASWTKEFATDCPPTPVTPAPVTFADKCETASDTYTIPTTTGVDYLVGTTVTAAGTYPATGTVTVTAQAQTGYVLEGTTSWTQAFTDETCVVASVGKAAYSAHSQDIGWGPTVVDGANAGAAGKRMESLRLKASATPAIAGDIQYRAHVQNIGWMSWQTSANAIGTTGRALRLEAFEIKLTGDLAAKFDIEYRANVQGTWQGWKRNGATAGTTGQSLRIELVQIRLVPKTA